MNNNIPPYLDSIIENFHYNLIESSRLNNEKGFTELLLTIRGDLLFGSLGKSIDAYQKLILIPANIYPHLSNNFKNILINIFTIRFSENIFIIDLEDNININFLNSTYFGLVSLMKSVISDENSDNFNVLIDELTQLSMTTKHRRSQSLYYYHSFAITILFWLFYLHQNNKIDITDYKIKFLEDIITNIIFNNETSFFNNFYKFEEDASDGLWNIERWEI